MNTNRRKVQFVAHARFLHRYIQTPSLQSEIYFIFSSVQHAIPFSVNTCDQVACSFILLIFPFNICFDFSKLLVVLMISPLLFLLSISSGSNISSKLLFCIFSLYSLLKAMFCSSVK